MIENAMELRGLALGKKIRYKTLISAGLVALAVLLPQLIHLALGQPGGVRWLPMYLPVLLAGCLLSSGWGAGVGLMSPLLSFLVTYAISEPMPAAARLPFMIAELAVFGCVAGLFSKKIAGNGLWAFPAVILAQVTGRAVFLGLVYVFNSFVPFTPAIIIEQIRTGFAGLAVQAVLVPLVVIGLRALLNKEDDR